MICIITSLCYNRECKAVISIVIPMMIMVMFDHERGDITNNSPVELVVEGGAKSAGLARSPPVVNGRSIVDLMLGWLGCGCVAVRLLGEGYSCCDMGVIIRAAAAP